MIVNEFGIAPGSFHLRGEKEEKTAGKSLGKIFEIFLFSKTVCHLQVFFVFATIDIRIGRGEP